MTQQIAHTQQTPLVSVVVLAFNQEDLVKEALESIVTQDFPAEQFEIIVGEDASTDGTAQVVKDYAAQYPNILPIFNPKNLGIVENYMNVLKHCRGKYVMGCGGDDYWLPGKMRKQVDFMQAHPDIAMIFGNWYCLENGKFYIEKRYIPLETFDELLYSCNVCAPTTCWRRSFWQDYLNAISPQKYAWNFEDYPLWLFLAKHSKIKYLNENFCVYRILQGSASRPVENPAKALKNIVDQWQVRLLFLEKYEPNQFPAKEKEAIEAVFDEAFTRLIAVPYSPYIADIALRFARLKKQLPLKQKMIVYLAQVPWAWKIVFGIKLFFKK